ncbi:MULTISPECIES: ABC transporter permease [Moraxella]|uniref:Transport permease protein n=1 Tax=Moraxella lacunata TaxID=477 RepID=A0A1B8Q5V8_MORLA|nr:MULTISPECIES: ABC transporter permease [Moraxella]MBE9578675.1 ABC transporter permease [Moraxella sp. K1664]MBE9587008.1 ABC transporter permease [Moraxella sp. K1630]MBE9595246.1 ABC transporter permease [Moraxella sp. K2450]MDH9218941.1 ABC transporter permease [Moraxella lacunata]MDI4482266.1 ABC transporter permease [Moraxella lacunata]
MNNQLTAFNTLLFKEIKRIVRIWPQTLLPPVITMTLYFVIFGQMIGSRVGEMGGVSYMQFIVPGLIMMSVITNSYSNVVSSFFSTKFHGSIDEMLVSPISKHAILLGYVGGGVFRGLAIALIVSIVALFFTKLTISSLPIMLITIIGTSVLFSLGGFINAVFARSFDDISIVPSFILTPLTYLGGVFYSLENLSPFWQNLSLLNPIVYMVNAFRYGILGHSDVNVGYSLLAILVFCAVFYGVAYKILKDGKRIRLS